ncbi:MAG: alpha/beta hydrolase [Gemmatimonadota bacterium]|nr:alpha/beta hydrolase [Gemmatimonadota bacterium]MDH3422974.1 alpha/beta hydrolase [Gemmatimonadota bacterium]
MSTYIRRIMPLPVALVVAGSLGVGEVSSQLPRQGLLSLDDARLFYEVVGSGDPIIVVHGGPGLDHSYLQPGLNVLARSNTLVYYDQRGTGRSTAALEPGVINMDAFVADIDALRQTLGYERVDVLGHSFGTRIALEYAARHPENVRALILMNPVEPGTRFTEQQAARQRAARSVEDSTELATLTGSEGFAARDRGTVSQVYRVLFRQTLRDRNRIAELDLDLAEATAKNGPDVARLLGESMGTGDWWDRLAEISSPTLVLHGRYDVAPLPMSEALARVLPLGRAVVLESGHFPYMEDPDGLLSAISAFQVDLSR